MAYAVGDRVQIKVDQDDGTTALVPGTVTTVSEETPYGVTIDGDDVESTWYVDSELETAPADEPDEPAEPDAAAATAARRGTRKIQNAPNARKLQGDERKRIGMIVGSEEAKGREALANHFAFETSMSVTEARAALGKSPKGEGGKAGEGGNRFERAMSNAGNPKVGPDGGGDNNADEGAAFADSYFAAKRQKRSA